jgi:hypothetical protein
MNKIKKIGLYIFLVIGIYSCRTIISFYPFYTKDVLVKEDRVNGVWQKEKDSSHVWRIMPIDQIKEFQDRDNKDSLKLTLQEKLMEKYGYFAVKFSKKDSTEKELYLLMFLKIEDELYADFYMFEWEDLFGKGLPKHHLTQVHTLAKVEIGNTLKFGWLKAGDLGKMMKDKKIRIKHESSDGRVLLTAKPKDLQKFIIKYAHKNQDRFGDVSMTLHKIENNEKFDIKFSL